MREGHYVVGLGRKSIAGSDHASDARPARNSKDPAEIDGVLPG
jgi:hypothetical protein